MGSPVVGLFRHRRSGRESVVKKANRRVQETRGQHRAERRSREEGKADQVVRVE